MDTGTISVLIADNNREFAVMLRDYLGTKENIRVTGIAGDGWTAYNMIAAYTPDIVILDIIMPRLDGLGVLGKIKNAEMAKKPLFIVLSAIGQHDRIIRDALALGARYYMMKPVDMDMLVERIMQLGEECGQSAG